MVCSGLALRLRMGFLRRRNGHGIPHAQHPKAGVGRDGGLAKAATRPATNPQRLVSSGPLNLVKIKISNKSSRPLFAQNRDEVFATLGSYGPEYLEYLETGMRDPAAFLEMQSVGPWKTASAAQMYNLACFVVSILLQIEESLQNPQF